MSKPLLRGALEAAPVSCEALKAKALAFEMGAIALREKLAATTTPMQVMFHAGPVACIRYLGNAFHHPLLFTRECR